jgi:CTP:molybdopterin cytidylyltransferase MocA
VTVAAVVLAAGGGTRFAGDGHKLLATFHGRPVVAHVLDAARGAGLAAVYVVVGAVELPGVAGVEGVKGADGVKVVRNERWAEGMATSLAAGVAAARAGGHDAVVVGLGDQPGVPAEAWRRVAAAGGPAAIATYGGTRGHPVRLAAEVWDRLPSTGDEGARGLLAALGPAVVEVPCPGSPADIDTVEDLSQWS